MSTENWLLFTPYVGASEQGGWGGKGQAPLELGIYIVKISKIRMISFFLLFGPPLGRVGAILMLLRRQG